MNFEYQLARRIVGRDRVSPLLSDAYKWSMAQAGSPLRPEVFVLSFRKGGPLYVPFDLRKLLGYLRPDTPTFEELAFLDSKGYSMTPAMRRALKGDLEVWCIPKGEWAQEGTPVGTVMGPSFLSSWYEDLAISLNFVMQVATAILAGQREFTATCKDEADIIHLVYSELLTSIGPSIDSIHVRVDVEGYRQSVRDALDAVLDAVGGDPDMIFECGTRAMTCYQMHRICLEECRKKGVMKTANVLAAWELYMIPVGTTGHEHQQRHLVDADGFRAIRDCRPEPPSYLFDTTDIYRSGIPSALKVLREYERRASVRFDSEDHEKQLRIFAQAYHAEKIVADNLFFIFMDGYDAARTSKMMALCDELGIPNGAQHRLFGFGSYLVTPAPWQTLTRNAVAMVYKLAMTGPYPVMKSAGSKSSLPGRPVIFVREDNYNDRIVAQWGEKIEGYRLFEKSSGNANALPPAFGPISPSPETLRLIDQCRVRSAHYIESLEASA